MPEFHARLLDLSHKMAEATDSAALFVITRRALSELGCTDFSFAGTTSVRLGSQALELGVSLYHTTLDPALLRKTVGTNNYGNSIYLRRFLQHGLDSFFTDPTIYHDASPAELDHIAILHQAGYRRGYLGVLSRVPGHFTGIACHLDGIPEAELERHKDEICSRLLAVGKIMDTAFLSKHIIGHYGLSARERDVLSWLAAGLRPDQIADRLGVGAGSVDKYIVNAKEKLSARTRDHAVARALILGLLNI